MNTITLVHIGEDYATINVHNFGEFDIDHALAAALVAAGAEISLDGGDGEATRGDVLTVLTEVQ